MDSSSSTSPASNPVAKAMLNSGGAILQQQQRSTNNSENLPSDQQSEARLLDEHSVDSPQHAKSHSTADEPVIGNDDYAFQQTRQSNGLEKLKGRFKLKSKLKTRSDCKKLPVLTCVELIEFNNKSNDQPDQVEPATLERVNGDAKKSISKKILFKDYVLISAKTKFKYLIHSIFKNTSLSSKDNYKVLDGSLKLKNWNPISLKSISSIPQASLPSKSNKDSEKTEVFDQVEYQGEVKSEATVEKPAPNRSRSSSSESNQSQSSQLQETEFGGDSADLAKSYFGSENEASCDEDENNLKPSKKSGSSDSDVTVNDVLAHVLGFAVLNIKIVNKNTDELALNESFGEAALEEHDFERNKKKFKRSASNDLHSASLKVSHEQDSSDESASPSTAMSHSLHKSGSLDCKLDDPNKSKLNDVLLPLLMLTSANASTASQLQSGMPSPYQASKNSPNQATNALTASLSLLNNQYLAQLLNGAAAVAAAAAVANNSVPKITQSYQELIGLSSYDKPSPSNTGSTSSNSAAKSWPTKKTSSPVTNLKSPGSLNNLIHAKNLSVNVGHSYAPSSANGFQQSTNGGQGVIFSASPSPSVSSTASSCTSTSMNNMNLKKEPFDPSKNGALNNSDQRPVKLPKLVQESSRPSTASFNLPHNTYLPNENNITSSNLNRRQRERTTFDPQEEITRLMKIFEKTHHPTRYQIASICDSLNALPCRKDKKPLEPYNIQYWFKNARAALRRRVKDDGDMPQRSGSVVSSSNKAKPESEDAESDFIQSIMKNDRKYMNEDSNYSNEDEDDEEEEDEEGARDLYARGNLYNDENENSQSKEHDEQDSNSEAPKLGQNHSSLSIHDNNGDNFQQNFQSLLRKRVSNNLEESSVNKSKTLSRIRSNNNYAIENESENERDYAIKDKAKFPGRNGQAAFMSDNDLSGARGRHEEEEDDNELGEQDYYENEGYDDEDEDEDDHDDNEKSFKGNKPAGKAAGNGKGGMGGSSSSHNSRRNRVFIDPISEVPILEHYFSIETYPDHYLIEKICENLNKGEYRCKFPKLESRNIQLWFKNHRAKLKRLKSTPTPTLTPVASNPVSSASRQSTPLLRNNGDKHVFKAKPAAPSMIPAANYEDDESDDDGYGDEDENEIARNGTHGASLNRMAKENSQLNDDNSDEWAGLYAGKRDSHVLQSYNGGLNKKKVKVDVAVRQHPGTETSTNSSLLSSSSSSTSSSGSSSSALTLKKTDNVPVLT